MAPKSKKSSYIPSIDAFHLTHWNGVVRLAEALPLTYKLQQHLSDGARVGLVSLFYFILFYFFHFDMFLGL